MYAHSFTSCDRDARRQLLLCTMHIQFLRFWFIRIHFFCVCALTVCSVQQLLAEAHKKVQKSHQQQHLHELLLCVISIIIIIKSVVPFSIFILKSILFYCLFLKSRVGWLNTIFRSDCFVFLLVKYGINCHFQRLLLFICIYLILYVRLLK